MKKTLFIFGCLGIATAQADLAVTLSGVWKSDCFKPGADMSAQATLTCSKVTCEHQINIYSNPSCKGEAMGLEPLSINYEIEGHVSGTIYDIVLSGPDTSKCYGRIKLEEDQFYLFKSADGNHDCSTPSGRLTEIDESMPFRKESAE